MTYIECAQKVIAEGAQLIRQRKDDLRQWDCKPIFTGNKRGWIMLDAFTAHAMMAVHKRLTPENQAKIIEKLSLRKYINFCWKAVK